MEDHKHFQFGIEVFLLSNALPQGQLTEVPLYFEIFNIKVDGQTIKACSTNKISKLYLNETTILVICKDKRAIFFYSIKLTFCLKISQNQDFGSGQEVVPDFLK